MNAPRSKKQMYRLYEQGSFGNRLQSWSSVDAFAESGFGGSVSLRYAGDAGGRWAAYDVASGDVVSRVSEWVSEGATASLVKINESAPDERLVLQGEVGRHPLLGGLVLRYSDWKTKMRDAMKHAEHCWGLEALMRLRTVLTPSSYEDVMALLEDYAGAIVEFSAYAMCLGDCRGRNAVIWEVRGY